MNADFECLIEKEAMWAAMLMQVLRENNIPCTTAPVNGAGFSLKTGIQDRLRVFVPAERLLSAKALLNELFPEETA